MIYNVHVTMQGLFHNECLSQLAGQYSGLLCGCTAYLDFKALVGASGRLVLNCFLWVLPLFVYVVIVTFNGDSSLSCIQKSGV